MLVVSLGGVAVVGSKDIMAVSRAWGRSFAGLRRLHSVHSLSNSVSLSGIRWHPALEPIVRQSPKCAGHLRFFAQAAALEESPELSHKKSARLSRAERYALVENFVLKHKDANEGKLPSVHAIVKEIGGSRLIIKDIVDELEKKSNSYREAEPVGTENSSPDIVAEPQVKKEEEELANSDSEYDEGLEPLNLENESKATRNDSEPLVDDSSSATNDSSSNAGGKSNLKSREIESGPGLWRRLRALGQPEPREEPAQENSSAAGRALTPALDSYSSEEDEEESDFPEEDYEEAKDLEPRDVSGNQNKSSSARFSSEPSTGENHGLFIRFLPLAATEADLRAAFQGCGEIVRAQAMMPKGPGLKFTYGFVDFSTPEALSKALKKDKVFIKGSTILTEACSGPRRVDSRSTSTRKPVIENFKKSDAYRPSDKPTNGSRISAVNKFRRVDSQAGNENGARSASNNGSYLVVVEGLPYPMPISAVEKMLSAHGDISRSELAREDGGTYSAQVEFKTEEARDSALASSRVYLAGRWCRITSGEPILTTVVRLANVGSVSENFILQRCGKIGRVDNIVQRKEGVFDVYYHPSEQRNMRKILDRLGEVNADFKRWRPNLAPKCSLEGIQNSSDFQDWVEVQKDKLLSNLTGAMQLMIIDLEDLRDLVESERSELSNSRKSRNFERSSAPRANRLS